MPDVPPITVVDPRDPGRPLDLLGDDRPPRQVSTRLLAVVGVGVLLVGGGVLAARAVQQDRARDAAFAIADAVHLRAQVDAVYGQGPGSRLLGVDVTAVELPGRPPGERVTALELQGPALEPQPPVPASAAVEFPQLRASSEVDCTAVGAGRGPDRADLVMTVTALSGVPHEQRVPVDPGRLRDLALEACDLPDPDARPVVEAYGSGGRAFLFVETRPRDGAALRVTGLQVPGLSVRLFGQPLPLELSPDSGAFLGLDVTVDDCAVARSGGLVLSVTLSRAGVETTSTAAPSATQPQPGSVPLADVLLAVVDRAC